MERIVIINESTFRKWMGRVQELLKVLHSQELRVKNKELGSWLDTNEVCEMLCLGRRTVLAMRERGELPYTKIDHKIYHRAEDVIRLIGSHTIENLQGTDNCNVSPNRKK